MVACFQAYSRLPMRQFIYQRCRDMIVIVSQLPMRQFTIKHSSAYCAPKATYSCFEKKVLKQGNAGTVPR